MGFYKKEFLELRSLCEKKDICLVAVSKVRTEQDIMAAYQEGQLDFGENYVQELIAKSDALPKNIRWHFIGHLQTNKVKLIAPFVHLVHGVDNLKLLIELNKYAFKLNKKINCLLQVHIAREETKFGFSEDEIAEIDIKSFPGLNICGLMGMASFSDETNVVKNEFRQLNTLFKSMQKSNPAFQMLSMGMSGDYQIAIEEGSTMIRVGSLIFGERG